MVACIFQVFDAMGNCLSAGIKAESHSNTGLSSKYDSGDGKDISSESSNSKVSSFSAPLTPRSEGEILQSPNLKSFSFADLKMATRNFRPDSVLGEGGFGSVFKGWIDENSFTATKPGSGIVIAVKRLNQDGFQGHKEWLAEVNFLGQLYHPNLVKLIGYCLEDEHRLLVYEFMPRGSLENHLFRRGSYFQPLSWSLRLKVALGAAKGLAFLHSAETRVIYRDFKTSNILLDTNYNAKLSDFGLAKDGPTGDKSHVSTRVMGTYGYAAPEYLATGHLSARSDVYSFGVVLLEMLSGRRAVDKNRPSGEHKLVEWAKPYLANKRKIFRVLDNRLEGQYTIEIMSTTHLLILLLGVVALATPSFGTYESPNYGKPPTPVYKPPKVKPPPYEHKPPVYEPPKKEKPEPKPPVYTPPKKEKPEPKPPVYEPPKKEKPEPKPPVYTPPKKEKPEPKPPVYEPPKKEKPEPKPPIYMPPKKEKPKLKPPVYEPPKKEKPEPKPPVYAPPKKEKPEPKPPVYKPPKKPPVYEPKPPKPPVYTPPKKEKPEPKPPVHESPKKPPYGHYPGHPPLGKPQ